MWSIRETAVWLRICCGTYYTFRCYLIGVNYGAMGAMKSKGLSAVSTIKDLLIAACDASVLTDKTLSHLCDKHESLISLTQCWWTNGNLSFYCSIFVLFFMGRQQRVKSILLMVCALFLLLNIFVRAHMLRVLQHYLETREMLFQTDTQTDVCASVCIISVKEWRYCQNASVSMPSLL